MAAKIRTTVYNQFRGVDFSSDQTRISRSRSPWALNLIPDADGCPEKRPGWRVLAAFAGTKVLGIYRFRRKSGEWDTLLHREHDLVRWNPETLTVESVLMDGLTGTETFGFQLGGKFCLLTGKEYLYYDGYKAGYMEEIARIPLIVAGRLPDGGGEAIEDVNLLTPLRKVGFNGDGKSTEYQLPSTEIDGIDSITVNGTELGETAYSADLEAGTVTFQTAPSMPGVTGEDNVFITYKKIVHQEEELVISAGELTEGEMEMEPLAEASVTGERLEYPSSLSYLDDGMTARLYLGYTRGSDGNDSEYGFGRVILSCKAGDSVTFKIAMNPASSGYFRGYYVNGLNGVDAYTRIRGGKTFSGTAAGRILIQFETDFADTTFTVSNISINGRQAGFGEAGAKTAVSFLNLAAEPYAELDIYGVVKVTVDNIEHPAGDTPNEAEDGSWGYDAEERRLNFTDEMEVSDRYIITYQTSEDGNRNRILRCRFGVLYGYGNNDRIFLSGNRKYQNYDWFSGMDDPAYFGDLGYSVVGAEHSAVMGYARSGSALAILKEENAQDSTIYLRTAAFDSEGNLYFPLRQSAANIGMVAENTVAYIGDEPLFLSPSGVYGLVSNTLTSERMVQNRSFYIDPALKAEPDKNAVAASWNNRYFLVYPSGNAYLLDGNSGASASRRADTGYLYECWHWSDIPAKRLFVLDGVLYFITEEGLLCRFNDDLPEKERWNDNGQPIDCQWATPMDDDGDFMMLKTMVKAGCGIQVKGYLASSAEVMFRTDEDKEPRPFLTEQTGQWETWEELDFTRFRFRVSDAPEVIPLRTSIRRYSALQIVCRNRILNEGFGILGIVKRFLVEKYRKW